MMLPVPFFPSWLPKHFEEIDQARSISVELVLEIHVINSTDCNAFHASCSMSKRSLLHPPSKIKRARVR